MHLVSDQALCAKPPVGGWRVCFKQRLAQSKTGDVSILEAGNMRSLSSCFQQDDYAVYLGSVCG